MLLSMGLSGPPCGTPSVVSSYLCPTITPALRYLCISDMTLPSLMVSPATLPLTLSLVSSFCAWSQTFVLSFLPIPLAVDTVASDYALPAIGARSGLAPIRLCPCRANIKHRHTLNEVGDVAEGKYDWKIERGQGGIRL